MKNVSSFIKVSKIFILFFSLSFYSLYAQENSEDLIDSYEVYTSDAREIAYAHLNKSKYLIGEDIGFTVYVLDKKNKLPSKLTTNLYVTLEDENNKVVKQKLLKIENGVVSNKFVVDSSLTSGYYTFKAFTSWMRNFNEQDYFIETIRIIDPKAEKYITSKIISKTIDAQFLPESGHLLLNVENTLGVIIKDSLGLGVPFAEGEVVDIKNNNITTFKTNQFGIGKFIIIPKTDDRYSININYNQNKAVFNLAENLKLRGVVLSYKMQKDKGLLSVVTNKETLKTLKNKTYTLLVHNGDDFEKFDITFKNKTTILVVIDFKNCPTGMNIATLFNENHQPVSERLFFNYNGLNILKSETVSAKKLRDSVSINLGFKNIDPSKFNQLSISVLPSETLSHVKHHNIISYNYVQPYVKGKIENGRYYFNNINDNKKLELDNLLITQGWSSYDWFDIFNKPDYFSYAFEQGFTLKGNINGVKNEETYMLHASNDAEPQFFDVNESESVFTAENVFIKDKDSVYFSKVNDKDDLRPALLYLQSYPSEIPQLLTSVNTMFPESTLIQAKEIKVQRVIRASLSRVQELEEVLIQSESEKNRIRTRQLSRVRPGRVRIISQIDRNAFYSLDEFLAANMLRVTLNDQTGEVAYSAGRDGGAMAVFLDDVQLWQTGVLYRRPLSAFDFIEIDRSGIGGGARGGNGILRLYSLSVSAYALLFARETVKGYKTELTFSPNKTFYMPRYQYYDDDFFTSYGVVDWKPQLKLNENGTVSLKIKQPQVPITLFIEGIANDGSFIFEEKAITLN